VAQYKLCACRKGEACFASDCTKIILSLARLKQPCRQNVV
jgi:hypothetical protein